jgi:hypothetical protein
MSRQVGVHRTALGYGASYVTVMPGSLEGSRGRSCKVFTSPDDRGVRGPGQRRLPDDGAVCRRADGPACTTRPASTTSGLRRPPASGLVPDWWYTETPLTGYKFIERRDHNLGVCPVVRFRDRMLLDGEEVFGIVEPLMAMQQRVDETVFGLLTAQYFAAFKQRYMIGWIPRMRARSSAASAAEFWAFKDDTDVKVGEFTETDLTRYLDSKDSAIGDLAAVAQIPAQALGSSKVITSPLKRWRRCRTARTARRRDHHSFR